MSRISILSCITAHEGRLPSTEVDAWGDNKVATVAPVRGRVDWSIDEKIVFVSFAIGVQCNFLRVTEGEAGALGMGGPRKRGLINALRLDMTSQVDSPSLPLPTSRKSSLLPASTGGVGLGRLVIRFPTA